MSVDQVFETDETDVSDNRETEAFPSCRSDFSLCWSTTPSLTYLTFALSTPIPKLMVATITGIFSSIHSFWIEVLSAALSPGNGKRWNETKQNSKQKYFIPSPFSHYEPSPSVRTDRRTRSSLPMFKLAWDQAEVSNSCFYSKVKNLKHSCEETSCYI